VSMNIETVVKATERGEEYAQQYLERIMAAARPEAVFGTPVVSGQYTVITACQVAAGGGFGSGIGMGASPSVPKGEETSQEGAKPSESVGGGGGMGGGGGSTGRPVAVITIGPDGVTVKPIVDVTRFMLAAIATSAAMAMAFMRVRRAMRR